MNSNKQTTSFRDCSTSNAKLGEGGGWVPMARNINGTQHSRCSSWEICQSMPKIRVGGRMEIV